MKPSLAQVQKLCVKTGTFISTNTVNYISTKWNFSQTTKLGDIFLVYYILLF